MLYILCKTHIYFLSIIFIEVLFGQYKTYAQNLRDTYAEMIKDFKKPPAKYSTAPFWVWNYIVTKSMIDKQLKLFKSIGINQVIIHPRPGLVTEYLSNEWFELIKYAVNSAKKLGMNVFLYDENSYPSGFGGGHVPAELPDVKIKYLTPIITTQPDSVKNKLCVLKKMGESFVEIKDNVYKKDVSYYVFYFDIPESNPWYAGFSYVDLLQKRSTQKFIETTHEKYKTAIGKEFGKNVIGVFTDEPYPDFRQLPYTPALFDKFQEKNGYDLKINLPSLIEEVGDYRKVRHDTYKLILDMFLNAWVKPYSEWCSKNNLALTGHYWEHIWGDLGYGPDDMASLSYSHIPGIDLLFNHYSNNLNDQFGNDMMVREIKSVANQMGRERLLSETYGASGWDLTFKDMKRMGDWEYALGVNLMTQHLFWQSMTGYRKYDHPPTFSYHSPYFEDYKVLSEYYARLSAILSKGVQNNKILLLEPTTSIWMYWRHTSTHVENTSVDSIRMDCVNAFHKLTHEFESAQVEYDIGSEYLIHEYGKIEGTSFCINKCSYSLFIIPPYTENLESKTFELLSDFLKNGGKVISTMQLPSYIEGVISDKVTKLAESFKNNWIQVEELRPQVIEKITKQAVIFNIASGNDKLYHMRKELKDAQILFIANVDESLISEGTIELKGGSAEKMDLFTGNTSPLPFKINGENIIIDFKLEPGGSTLIVSRDIKTEPGKETLSNSSKVEFADKLNINRESPNMLLIDFCDLRVKGESYKDMYFADAQKKVFNLHGLKQNPWMGIQFKNLVIDTNKFDDNSGFEADYKFTIDENTDISKLQAVYERPEIYQLKINGIVVSPIKGKWFIDKDFAMYDISKYAKIGLNIVSVISKPMTVLSELDRLIILGDFRLDAQELGFKLEPWKPLELGDWTKQGMQLYSGRVDYEHEIDIKDNASYYIKLSDWKGACTEVYINEVFAGIIAFNPFELDITKHLKQGKNKIRVVVVSTLRNLFGPHHTTKAVSETWPTHFMSVNSDEGCSLAGASYFIYPYGLMKDFELFRK